MLKRENLTVLLEYYPHLKGRFYPGGYCFFTVLHGGEKTACLAAWPTTFEGRRLRRPSFRENSTEIVQILEILEADLDREYRHFVVGRGLSNAGRQF